MKSHKRRATDGKSHQITASASHVDPSSHARPGHRTRAPSVPSMTRWVRTLLAELTTWGRLVVGETMSEPSRPEMKKGSADLVPKRRAQRGRR
eukprot:1117927-Rhodomonas_salina.4